jgi:acyl carrier protein
MSADRHELIYDKVVHTIADIAGVSLNELNGQTELIVDLNLDSLAMYEIVVDLEEAFDLQIPDEDIDRVHSVDDVVRYIEQSLPG